MFDILWLSCGWLKGAWKSEVVGRIAKGGGKEKGQAFWEEGREHQHEDKNMDANQQRGISGEEAGGSSAPGLRSAIPSFIMIWGQFTYSYEIEHKKV